MSWKNSAVVRSHMTAWPNTGILALWTLNQDGRIIVQQSLNAIRPKDFESYRHLQGKNYTIEREPTEEEYVDMISPPEQGVSSILCM
jgi:hypothetical protein